VLLDLSKVAGARASGNPSSVLRSRGPNYTIASKAKPITLPIYSDNRPIKSGLKPEKGPLVIYDWAYYLSPAVVKSFEKKYGVKASVTTFSTTDEAVNKVASGAITPDVWVPSAQQIVQLVAAKLIQPINHHYIPNLNNVIPAAGDPWYDRGARYSTPNFINTFGIGWRNDLLKINPAKMKNPWDVFWDTHDGSPIGLCNADPEDAMTMALIRSGKTSFEALTQADIQGAAHQISQIKDAKWQYTAFQPLGTGTERLAFCFNGDMEVVPHYLSKNVPLSAVSYYFPHNGKGLILNDMWLIPKSSKNPVLAHLFLNHFLEEQSAIDNFRDVGYQTMLKGLTTEKLEAAKVAPKHAIQMAFSPPNFQSLGIAAPIYNTTQIQWIEQAFTALTSGAG
jgi:spermidine/putrescine transport system substrate-binding protein